ncbi:lipoprotein-releasing system permease protein [Catalinimonas alkaloidigena]|uniref:ABC transporter permease n=1 Tax=Catalinimonas alkaloidigena TaxID=1075417 RepID=UPI0024073BAE|nr:FtsX-like permease family protein [Catalinimonas alkaloidigena]MDF9800388.1 lipoprotein-releasing system permease protein [Catalinimonas alkaloidigena]
MNLPYFISKKINKAENKSFSATINKIAVASIALGLATMLVSFLILGGFKRVITNKIFTFNGHIQVTKYSLDNSLQEEPISVNNPLIQNPEQFDFIDHVQVFGHTAGLLQTDNEVYGAFIKGIGPNFDSLRFKDNLLEGSFIHFSDSNDNSPNSYSTEVLISNKIANTLQLNVGDDVRMLFIDPYRVRKLHVRGIYNTGIEEFDEQMIIGDIGLVRRINQWSDSLVGGIEVYLKDYDAMAEAENRLQNDLDYDLFIEKVGDKYVQMFEWLDLINNNVIIFLSLILFVACFNIVSILLILIMERTQMIGILKALGARNRQIRKIFRYNGILLIVRGMMIGNLIGIGFGLLQYFFKIIPLDPENYYMDYVPIHWDLLAIVGLNLLTFTIVVLVLNIPTIIILRINPIKAIRFD